MKRFLYIEARDVSVPEDGGPMVSFATTWVDAEDDHAAYRLGRLQLWDRLREPGGDPFNHSSGRILNDYVVDMPVA